MTLPGGFLNLEIWGEAMIVITTSSGLIGRQVLGNVLNRGKPIRVIVREPSRLPSEARKRIDVVQG